MVNRFKEFINVLKALDDQNVDYILIGGIAVILHGYERLTTDIDLFLENKKENIKKLKKALESIFDDPSIEEISSEELNKYPVIRYGTPNGFNIDIMTNIGEIFSYDDLEYETIEYEGIKIKLGTLETLIKMKKDTMRYKDRADYLFLKELQKKKGNPDK